MKHKFILAIVGICLGSCASYQSFVQVEGRSDVPQGAKEIIVYSDMATISSVLKDEGIMYRHIEGGIETEEILIDEGTRAKFSIIEYSEGLKLVPYWGITDKVRQQMVMWAGYAAASAHTNELSRVIYDKTQTRSKMVFDYAAGIGLKAGDIEYR